VRSCRVEARDLRLGKPAPHGSFYAFDHGFEDRRRKHSVDMEDAAAGIAETVLSARRNHQ